MKFLKRFVLTLILPKLLCFNQLKLRCCFFLNRHFSRVTKSCIFKNLNLREKADRNFRLNFVKNCLGT